MPIREVDFTGDDEAVSWHSIEEAARRDGVERIALTPAQVRILTADLAAVASGRQRIEDSSFRVASRGVLFQCSVCAAIELTGGWIPIPHSGHGGKWMLASAALSERWAQREIEPNHGKWG